MSRREDKDEKVSVKEITRLLSEEIHKIARIGGWELDAATGKTIWTSETYRIHGIPEGTPTDKLSWVDLYGPNQRERIIKYIHECLNGKPYQDIFEFTDETGKHKWLELMGKPIIDANGKVSRLVGTFQDVTERIQKEQEIQFILEALGIGVWKFNPITQNLFWDKSMYQLYNISEKNFSTHYSAWENSLTSEARAKAVRDLELALRGEKDFDTTFDIDTKDYGRRSIAARAKVIRNQNGNPVMMLGINFDRTKENIALKELELEKVKSMRNAKLASLGEMSAGIAHEINNPLAIISGTIRVLPNFLDHPDMLARKIDIIMNASERIAKLVRSLKKFSRTSDKSEYKMHSLIGILNEAVTLTDALARRHTTKVEIRCDPDFMLLCDEIEMAQVFINLISNAIDAVKNLPERWVTLNLRRNNARCWLQVRDSGPRIKPDIEKNLFQPFFTTKPVGQGTGLGLSIAKGILDEHHATIELLANDPHTCFEICFPNVEDKKNAA